MSDTQRFGEIMDRFVQHERQGEAERQDRSERKKNGGRKARRRAQSRMAR